VEVLDVDNYASWATQMQCVLTVKSLWKYVTGETDLSTAELKAKDAAAKATIGLYLKAHHHPMLKASATAKELWDGLAAAFKSKSLAREVLLMKTLNQLKLKSGEPIANYYVVRGASKGHSGGAGNH
jgi:hypothetical protein